MTTVHRRIYAAALALATALLAYPAIAAKVPISISGPTHALLVALAFLVYPTAEAKRASLRPAAPAVPVSVSVPPSPLPDLSEPPSEPTSPDKPGAT